MESVDFAYEFEEPIFPSTHQALAEPNGLLASGGRLSPIWLNAAYQKGIFPWNNPEEERLWWSPAPRAVITQDSFRIPRTVRKELKKSRFKFTINLASEAVIQACALPRQDDSGTWIDQDIMLEYPELIQSGRGMSVECWEPSGQLVGGFYGLLIGKAFFGESMFSRVSGASKLAFARAAPYLFDAGIEMIDCQMNTEHMARFGLLELDRDAFEALLTEATRNQQPVVLPGVIA